MNAADIPPDLLIKAADMRALGFCLIPGVKRWSEANGLDFREFVKKGISARTIFAIGDEFGMRAVAYVMEKTNGR